jgi:hypothetical protein
MKKIMKMVITSLATFSISRLMMPKRRWSFAVNLRNLKILKTASTLMVCMNLISV